MKSTRSLHLMASVLLLSLSVNLVSCSKNDNSSDNPSTHLCTTCPSVPEALAEHDNSSKGIYKGVVIGSSGTIKFNVANNNSDITATLTLDGETLILTSSLTWEAGQAYIAPFTGQYNGQPVTITFHVDANGDNATITSADIPGHPNAVFILVKETSNALIEGYEGSYSKSNSESGTFNILLSKALGKWGGIARKNGETEVEDIEGTITASGQIFEEHGYNVGTLSGETISGNYVEQGGITVTISAQRTL